MAQVIINSIKFFNETRNGTDFSLNTSDFTTTLKGNVGEKVKALINFEYNNIFAFNPSTNNVTFNVRVDGGENVIEINGGNITQLGFKKGDQIELRDLKVGPPSVGVLRVQETILSISGKKMKVTNTGTFTTGFYDTGELRLLTELKDFRFTYNTPIDIGGVRSPYTPFNVPQEFNVNAVGDGGPRSTAFVNGNPRNPNLWNGGAFRMRYVSDPITYTQRFELEHEFIIKPYHLEGNVYSPLTAPTEFDQGTLAYVFDLEDTTNGTREVLTYDEVANVGWFNENFDGVATSYSLSSISYYDLTEAESITAINFDNVTRVTAQVNGTLFTAGDGVVVYHSKAPSEAEYQNVNNTYSDNWINESLRNTIGAVSNSGTIIQNLSINLDDPNNITIQFDLDFTNEDVIPGDSYLLWFGLEDGSGGFDAELSNRTSLFADSQEYIKNFDESDLFEVTKFEVYDHLSDLDVDAPTTNYEGYVEDGVLFDIEWTWKKEDDGNDRQNIDDLRVGLCAYNTTSDLYFYITNQYTYTSRDGGDDVGFKHPLDWLNSIRFQDFLLANDDQFNKSHGGSPTLFNDTEYVSNDGTFATYRSRIGVKLDWQEIRPLDENRSTARVYDDIADEFNGDRFSLGDVIAQAVFDDPTQLRNGYNKKMSNYSKGDWIIRPVITSVVDNINVANTETQFIHFMPEFKVYDYDTNSDYTATIDTFDINDNTLDGELLFGEDNKVVATFDDGETKTDIADFEGVMRIEVENQSGFAIHELSTFRDTYDGNILKGFGSGGVNVEKSINGSDQYVMTCLVDGTQLDADRYKITARIFDKDIFNPYTDKDLIGWYDVSGLITNTNNVYGDVDASDNVITWKNLKTDANATPDLSTPTSAERPLLDEVNKNVVFDGVDDGLYWENDALYPICSIFVVMEVNGAGGIHNVLHYIDDDAQVPNNNDVQMYQDTSGGFAVSKVDSWLPGVFPSPATKTSIDESAEITPSRVASDKSIVQFVLYPNNDWYMKVDNTRIDLPDANQNNSAIDQSDNIFGVGSLYRGTGGVPLNFASYAGKFKEILIFKADVSDREDTIYNTLATKWGI